MRLDRVARRGLVWVGLWAVVCLGMVINHHPLGADVFSAVLVISVCWWYGSLRDRVRDREREETLRASGFDHIDMMTGVEFEGYFAAVLRGLGYDVTTTKTTGDFGVDLVAARDGTRTAVQCKRKRGGAVGAAAVQQVVAGARMHECNATMVVTNNLFTRAAQQLAVVHDCELVDRRRLRQLVFDTCSDMSSTAPHGHPNSAQADSDICTGVNGLQNRGEDFYRSYRNLTGTEWTIRRQRKTARQPASNLGDGRSATWSDGWVCRDQRGQSWLTVAAGKGGSRRRQARTTFRRHREWVAGIRRGPRADFDVHLIYRRLDRLRKGRTCSGLVQSERPAESLNLENEGNAQLSSARSDQREPPSGGGTADGHLGTVARWLR